MSSPRRQTFFERSVASPEQKPPEIVNSLSGTEAKKEEVMESSQIYQQGLEEEHLPQQQRQGRRNSFMETYK